MRRLRYFWLTTLVATVACGDWLLATQPTASRAEIRWDDAGVPHILTADETALFYAFGWAQMESHPNLIPKLYGKARGRGAEYWGENLVESDIMVRALEIPETGKLWYAAQSADFKPYIDAFVAGLNAYSDAHPDRINLDNRSVLPLKPEDVFSHLQYIIELGFTGRSLLRNISRPPSMGSSAVALAPKKSSTGNALLLINPHLPWSGLYTLYEAHFKRGDDDLYGVTLVGLPVLIMAFNSELGWGHTKNQVAGAELFEVKAIDDDSYLFEAKPTAFRKRTTQIRVKTNGGEKELSHELRYTVHGAVLSTFGERVLVYRSTQGRYPQLLNQYWHMANAHTLAEFDRALQMMQLPLFNTVYADREGHISYIWTGLVPKRLPGESPRMNKPTPGGEAGTLWTETYKFTSLPRVTDPVSGWLQNTNDGPWTCTLPSPFDQMLYTSVVSEDEAIYFRTQQTLQKLKSTDTFTFDALEKLRFQNRMEVADRVLDDLLQAISSSVPTAEGDRGLLTECHATLNTWDRRVEAESKGAVLFKAWLENMGADLFSQSYDPNHALTTPRGIKDPAKAVEKLLVAAKTVKQRYGNLAVKWGEVYRLKRGAVDLPASGGPDLMGIFETLEFAPSDDRRYEVVSGDCYSAIVEFSRPLKAKVLLTYGNSSEPDSPNHGDQLALLAQKKMRTALLSDSDLGCIQRREQLQMDPVVFKGSSPFQSDLSSLTDSQTSAH